MMTDVQPMTITISKEYYETVMQQHDEIVDLIINKAEEMAMIQYDRPPIGTCCETDFDERDGKLLVQFEERYCGDSDYDTYHVPLEFLFDPDYAEKYKVIWAEEQRKKEEERILRESKKKVYKVVKHTEEYDQQEYRRLKIKYEGIIVDKTVPTITMGE